MLLESRHCSPIPWPFLDSHSTLALMTVVRGFQRSRFLVEKRFRRQRAVAGKAAWIPPPVKAPIRYYSFVPYDETSPSSKPKKKDPLKVPSEEVDHITSLPFDTPRQCIDNANALLIASCSSSLNYDSRWHRAFLQLIARCLVSRGDLVLDRAMTLARRSQSLGLPLHKPLLLRLGETVAGAEDSTIIEKAFPDFVDWCDLDLETVRPTLMKLAEMRRYECLDSVVSVLLGRLESIALDWKTTKELFLAFYDNAVEDSSLHPPVRLVARLEPSLLALIQPSMLPESLRLNMTDLSEEDHYLPQVHQYVREEKESRQDYDRRMVTFPLTQAFEDVRSRWILSFLLRNERDTKLPSVQVIGTMQDGEDVLEVVELKDDDMIDEDVLYLRDLTHYQFPDVTNQVIALNGGQPLRFTAEYEEYLWDRDYDDDMPLLESILKGSRFALDDWDDDDDSDSD